MAGSGEPVEVTALRTNLVFITGAVTVGGTPQWFAHRLVEKAFITHRDAQGILGTLGVSPARQASQLMDSVFTKIDLSDEKRRVFLKFVDTFSHDPVYKDLVDKLMREGMEHKILTGISPYTLYTSIFSRATPMTVMHSYGRRRGGWKLRNKSAIFAVSAVRPP